jgi:hypothetical protein
VTASPIKCATNGDIRLAYRTIGEGPRDLVKDLVAGSGIEFEERGAHELKGIPDEWRLYAVSQS